MTQNPNTQVTYPGQLLFGLHGEQIMVHTPVGWVPASIQAFPVDHSSEGVMEVLIYQKDEERIKRFYTELDTRDAKTRPVTSGTASTTSLTRIKQALDAEIARKRTSDYQQALNIVQSGEDISPEQRDFLASFIRKHGPS